MTGRRSQIESLSNPLVKRMRLLREKRHRRAEGLFLAEGLRIATEAREAGVLPAWLFLGPEGDARSDGHTSELPSLMRSSYAVFCLKEHTPKLTPAQATHVLTTHLTGTTFTH